MNSYFNSDNENFKIIDENQFDDTENFYVDENDNCNITWSSRQKYLLSFYASGLVVSYWANYTVIVFLSKFDAQLGLKK